MVLTMGTGLVFGLAPAWSLSRVDVSRTLVRGDQPHRFLSRRGGQILIAAEVALCIVLLTGAGLMIRSFALMMSVDVGFDPDAVLTMDVSPIDKSQPALKHYYPALVESLRHVPGVAAAGAVSHMPLQSASPVTRGSVDAGGPVSLHVREFIAGYFDAIGLRVEQGRLPSPAEMAGSARAVVINERAAREMFGLQSPIGRRFELSRRGVFEVAAVVSNVLHSGPMKPPDPEVYLPFGTGQARAMIVVIRPSGDQPDLYAHLRRGAQSVGPRAIVQRIRTGTELFDQRVLTPRRRMVLLTLLGTLGFVLSMVGVFGMTAYAVARRTREVGVRIALGARAEQVVGAIVRESLVPALIGILVGSAAAAVTTGVIASFLFETRPVEPVTFAVVAIAVGLAVTLAAWVPARHAARVDPISALRVT
jgi:predicted permease